MCTKFAPPTPSTPVYEQGRRGGYTVPSASAAGGRAQCKETLTNKYRS